MVACFRGVACCDAQGGEGLGKGEEFVKWLVATGGKATIFLQSFEMHVVERQVSTQLRPTFHVYGVIHAQPMTAMHPNRTPIHHATLTRLKPRWEIRKRVPAQVRPYDGPLACCVRNVRRTAI